MSRQFLRAFDVDPLSKCEEFVAIKSKSNKWLGNLYALARKELAQLGVTLVFGGNGCTFSDEKRFYSHRRDPSSGRMASLIWMV